MSGWIGVDLDGTLAEYDGWKGPTHIGNPICSMVERVKAWRAEGRHVRIFTARAWPIGTIDVLSPTVEAAERVKSASVAVSAIEAWCELHVGERLPVTCVKDYGMVELWDDRAVRVLPNTGKRSDGLD